MPKKSTDLKLLPAAAMPDRSVAPVGATLAEVGPRNEVPIEPRTANQSVICHLMRNCGLVVEPVWPP